MALNKRHKELIIVIPLIIVLGVTLVGFTLQLEGPPIPETFSGLFVEYKGEMIGGEIQGNIIILENGTKMGLEEFKKITGYEG